MYFFNCQILNLNHEYKIVYIKEFYISNMRVYYDNKSDGGV